MPIEPCEEAQSVASRRVYGSLDKVVAHGDAGNAITARMGTGDALARLAAARRKLSGVSLP